MYNDAAFATDAPLLRRPPRHRLREAVLALAGPHARILAHQETNWASVTFTGTRHRMDLLFEGAEALEAGELFIAFLPEHQFAIPRQLVADATVTAVDHRFDPPRLELRCEFLLLEEA